MSELEWPNEKRCAVSLTFDDARLSQADLGLDLLDRHHVKATFYIMPAGVEARLDRWRRAVADGHEIGNHTLTHPCSANFPWIKNNALENFTLARMEEDIVSASEKIGSLLNVLPLTFAYPCGQKFVGRGAQCTSYVPLIAKHFLAGRGFKDEISNDPRRCDLAQLCGVELDGLRADQAVQLIERGGWLVFVGHDIGDDGPQTVLRETLDAICRHGRNPANRVWIDRMDRIAQHVYDSHHAAGWTG